MAYAAWSVVYGEQPSAAKWNILGTNDSSFNDGTGIADGVILPEHLRNGSSTLNTWVWDTWTPTLSNRFNNAKWTKACTYIQIGKTVHFKLKLTASTTTPMDGSGQPTFTLPVTAVSYVSGSVLGFGYLEDLATASWITAAQSVSTTTAYISIFGTASTYLSASAISNTVPMTWTTGDFIEIIGTYEAA